MVDLICRFMSEAYELDIYLQPDIASLGVSRWDGRWDGRNFVDHTAWVA